MTVAISSSGSFSRALSLRNKKNDKGLEFDIVLFSEVKQALLKSVLHKFSQKDITALKGVQKSQTLLLLIQFLRVFDILLVNYD